MELRSPHVVWYRIHPKDGRAERLSAPPEGGASTRAAGLGGRPMPDGSLKAHWDLDELRKQVSNWAGGDKGRGATGEAEGAESGPAGEGAAEGYECNEGREDRPEEAADRPLVGG
jgi:hypothetical protein